LSPVFKPLRRVKRFKHGFVPIKNGEIHEYKAPSFRSIHGFDSESDIDGNIYCISVSKPSYHNSKTEETLFSTDMESILWFLFSHGRNSLNWVKNLPYEISVYLKQFCMKGKNQDRLNDLRTVCRKSPIRIRLRNGKTLAIYFIENKYLCISDGKHQAVFYDISIFDKRSLEISAKDQLGYTKSDYGLSNSDIDIEATTKKLGYAKVRARCELDARLTREIAEKNVKKFVEIFGFIPRNWNSPASLAEEYVIRSVEEKYLKPFKPDFQSIEILKYAFRAFRGGLFQLFVKGKVSDVVQYDINSAYPDKIQNLPDMVNGYWKKVFEINPQATFGIYHVYSQFDGFLPYRTNHGIIYPLTKRLYENYLTAPEIIYLRSKNFAVFILDGYEFYHTSKPEFPFAELIKGLHEKKELAEVSGDKSAKLLYKLIMNSIYGKFAQNTKTIGKLFNPVYACYITALTRIQNVKFAQKMDKVYEIATDSVIGKSKKSLEETRGLGKFEKKEFPSEAVLIQTGLTIADNKLYRSRGIKIDSKNPIKLKNEYLETTRKRPVKMKESLVAHVPDMIAKFLPYTKRISYADENRNWEIANIKYEDIFENKINSAPLGDNWLKIRENDRGKSLSELLKSHEGIKNDF
jgi:hypothetical protein